MSKVIYVCLTLCMLFSIPTVSHARDYSDILSTFGLTTPSQPPTVACDLDVHSTNPDCRELQAADEQDVTLPSTSVTPDVYTVKMEQLILALTSMIDLLRQLQAR